MVNAVLLFLNIGTPELILIMFAVLMLFGGEKLPGLARGLGKGIRDFKDASEGVKREINNQIYNYEEKKTEVAGLEEHDEPARLEEHDTAALNEHNEDKPLLDYTPIEGTMPVGGHNVTEADAEEIQHATQAEHNEIHAAGSDKPAQN